MAIIIRIDVDRPYGRQPLTRHVLSRVSSDLYFPKVEAFGYLAELSEMLSWLNDAGARSYVFFRRCTLPSASILDLLCAGRHEIGLHLEDSRSFATFQNEKGLLERHIGRRVAAVSKHGSGRAKFGLHHHAPYEPHKYADWAARADIRLFLGNLQDPSLEPVRQDSGVVVFPSAFWLEPYWRDSGTFPSNWLLEHARWRDIVLLVHPENVLASPELVRDFQTFITELDSKIVQ